MAIVLSYLLFAQIETFLAFLEKFFSILFYTNRKYLLVQSVQLVFKLRVCKSVHLHTFK